MKKDELRKFREHKIYKYLVSAFIIGIATLLQYLAWPYVNPAPFLFYYPAVILACIFGDGTSAIILSLILSHYFFSPPYFTMELGKGDILRLLIFGISALLIRIIVKGEVEAKLQAESAVELLREEKNIREKFVSTLTHDLQTPLTAVKLSAQMLLRSKDEESHKKFGEKLIHNLSRIETMIKDLLDTNSIRAGKPLPLEIKQMDLVNCLSITINDMTSVHGDRFIFKAPDKLEGWWCEEAIRRILENLCVNAIKYGHESAKITVSITPAENSAEFGVHNEGSPIPSEECNKLFNPFERAGSARRSGKQGWGLGLTLVRGLTQAMGGSVSVKSSEVEGTTFSVTLPMDARKFAVEKTNH